MTETTDCDWSAIKKELKMESQADVSLIKHFNTSASVLIKY